MGLKYVVFIVMTFMASIIVYMKYEFIIWAVV